MKITIADRLEKGIGHFHRIFGILVVLLLIFVFATGIFRVESDEVAIILRFGQLVGDTEETQILQPGLHFAFPYIIDEVIHIPIAKVQEVVVSTHTSANQTIGDDLSSSGYVLSGDHNVVLIEATVKYRITDPVAYALYHVDSAKAIDDAVSGRLFAIASSAQVDDLLTTGKQELASRAMREAQDILDSIGCGITITGVELTDVVPPLTLQSAFEAVTNASVEKQTLIEQANEYREMVVPLAEAQAQLLIDTATSNRETTISQMVQNIATFEGLLEQYNLSPASVLEASIRTRISAILSRMQIYIIPDDRIPSTILLP